MRAFACLRTRHGRSWRRSTVTRDDPQGPGSRLGGGLKTSQCRVGYLPSIISYTPAYNTRYIHRSLLLCAAPAPVLLNHIVLL